MKLEADFSLQMFEDAVQKDTERINRLILNVYIQAGEEFIVLARSKSRTNGGFGDITGNLRSSIGYLVAVNGVPYTDKFFEGANGTDKATGVIQGKEESLRILNEEIGIKDGIVLIVNTGMDYSYKVEAGGRDVITGSGLEIAKRLISLLKTV